uniref:Uncharacterized protein n=1 Tax=Branchiostoma floridae TaxID=7739 RepID=C3YJZ5_BRAFL|eukprot:XP_002603441.1 hypothetical protein BRAFLDRAFT_80416 [Branchiostoma floridae]
MKRLVVWRDGPRHDFSKLKEKKRKRSSSRTASSTKSTASSTKGTASSTEGAGNSRANHVSNRDQDMGIMEPNVVSDVASSNIIFVSKYHIVERCGKAVQGICQWVYCCSCSRREQELVQSLSSDIADGATRISDNYCCHIRAVEHIVQDFDSKHGIEPSLNEDGINYGFEVMVKHESPDTPFTVLRTRLKEAARMEEEVQPSSTDSSVESVDHEASTADVQLGSTDSSVESVNHGGSTAEVQLGSTDSSVDHAESTAEAKDLPKRKEFLQEFLQEAFFLQEFLQEAFFLQECYRHSCRNSCRRKVSKLSTGAAPPSCAFLYLLDNNQVISTGPGHMKGFVNDPDIHARFRRASKNRPTSLRPGGRRNFWREENRPEWWPDHMPFSSPSVPCNIGGQRRKLRTDELITIVSCYQDHLRAKHHWQKKVLLDQWQQKVLLDQWQQKVLLDQWQQKVLLDQWQQKVLLDQWQQKVLLDQWQQKVLLDQWHHRWTHLYKLYRG